MTTLPNCYVVDRETRAIIYEAKGMPQARGFVDAHDDPCMILISVEKYAMEFQYQIVLMDYTSGQTVAHGPIVDLCEAPELMDNLRIVMLPVTDADVRTGVRA